MYKDCKTEQSIQRQRLLEQGLLRAMLDRQYEEISVSDLCDELNIPRKSFYRYFSGKDGALFALLDHTLMELLHVPSRPGQHSSPLMELERYFLFWQSNRALLEALQRSRLSGLLVERATQLSIGHQLIPQRFRQHPTGIRNAALSFTICGLTAMVLQWHYDGYSLSALQMAEIASEMLTNPLIV
jgi:AcrR family transcriptional regulator